MTARRMRDPRLPYEDPLEDVEVMVNGETIRYDRLSPVDELIIAANNEELTTRRIMWGLDRDDWLLAISELARDGHLDAAILIARRWCDVATTLVQYDRREPDPHGFEVLARLHHKAGDHAAEAATLREWLAAWDDNRGRTHGARRRITAKLERRCR